MERKFPGMLGRIISLGAELLAQGKMMQDSLNSEVLSQQQFRAPAPMGRFRSHQPKGFKKHNPAGTKLLLQVNNGRCTLRHTV